MQINSRTAESIRRAVLQGKKLPTEVIRPSGFSLPAVLELVATAAAYRSMRPMEELIATWQLQDDMPFSKAWEQWVNGNPPRVDDMHGTREYEFHSLRCTEDQTGTSFQLVQERFVRSLKGIELDVNLAYAFAGAFAEMTDNVIQHSAVRPAAFEGLAGYHVGMDYFSFSVIDIGRGILNSLQSSTRWAHLKSHDEALFAATCENASSRPGHIHGDGFKELFRAMADRKCRLRFRTGDAVLELKDAGDKREAVHVSSAPLQGFQMAIICSLSGEPVERKM